MMTPNTRVLGIMGSPRRHANTERLLDEVLAGARAGGAVTEKLIVSELKITPCQERYDCLKDGLCSIGDDMPKVYPKLAAYEVVVLASPIFFYGLSGQTKALVDRGQALWAKKHALKQVLPQNPPRRGLFLAVGATQGEKLFDGAQLTARYFFDAINVDYAGELLVRGVDKPGDIDQLATVMQEAFSLGKASANFQNNHETEVK